MSLLSPLRVFILFIKNMFRIYDKVNDYECYRPLLGFFFCSCTSPHCFRHTRATMLPSPCGVFVLFIQNYDGFFPVDNGDIVTVPLWGFCFVHEDMKALNNAYEEHSLPSPLGVFLLFINEKRRKNYEKLHVTVPSWGFSFVHVGRLKR